jgi:hypothetical protein
MGWQMENIKACSYIQFKIHFLQGGDQAVRRLDTNAYLEAFDRQSRHIIGYRQSRQSWPSQRR